MIMTTLGDTWSSRLAFTVLLVAVMACSRGGPVVVTEEVEGAPTAFELAHATYSGIMNEPVTLTGGRWEGEPYVEGGASRPMVGLIDHFVLTGDLDGDGLDEAATLLWDSSGGSGTRLYLAAMGSGDDVITNLGTALIGDRVQVRSGAIDNGQITLDIVRAGPEDAACCPTEKALVTWAMGEDGLSQIADETIGTLSLADLGGREWVLIELGREQPLPDDVEITMLFQDDRVSGSSGCNKYFAGIMAPNPGELEFNGMGATRMACPEPVMDLERRYLSALAGASSYSFLAGRLVLNCDTEDGPTALVFAQQESLSEVSIANG
jgi:heat shock protein HslJ